MAPSPDETFDDDVHPPVTSIARVLPIGIWTVVGLGTAAFGLWAVGLPALLVLGGAWLLAAALHYGSDSLAGPASWAAGVVLEVCLLTGLSAVLSRLRPHPHGSAAYLVVIVLPAVIGAVGLAAAVLRNRDRVLERRRGRPELAVLAHLAGFGVVAWIGNAGGQGVAWAMSGDARNHVLIVRHILGVGGLSVAQLRDYPAVVNTVTAVISGAGHRTGLEPGALMMHDARAVAATYVIAAIAVACLLMATLLELVPKVVAISRRLPLGVIVSVVLCAGLSASPLLLGTSLHDGYLSAYGALPVALASIALALRACAQPGPITTGLLGFATVATFFSWTPLAVVPAALTLVSCGVVVAGRRDLALRRPLWILGLVVAVGSMVALAGVFVSHRAQLETTFRSPGAIVPPQHKILYLLALIAVALMFGARDHIVRRQLIGPAVAALAGIYAAHWIAALSGNTNHSYYSVKTLYLVASCLIWLPFAPIVANVAGREGVEAVPWRSIRSVRAMVSGAALGLAVLVAISFTTPLSNQLSQARHGWQQPSAAGIDETAKLADQDRPFIFWAWSGNDRIDNFWAGMTWATSDYGAGVASSSTLPEGPLVWAYFQTGDIAQLCAISQGTPKLTVITADPTVAAKMGATCPTLHPPIEVLPPPK